jgi:hypothetical protein
MMFRELTLLPSSEDRLSLYTYIQVFMQHLWMVQPLTQMSKERDRNLTARHAKSGTNYINIPKTCV